MLHESALWVLRDKPFDVLRIPGWLMNGKAVLKRELAGRSAFHAGSLPYNESLLEWLEQQRIAGRKLILCTASDQSIADAIAGHLGVFDEVMASSGEFNLAGPNKAAALVRRFGEGGFDYVGNSSADLAVWNLARRAIVVNAPASIVRQARERCEVEQVFPRARPGWRSWGRILRLHQWIKNLLLFIPLMAGHVFSSIEPWLALALAFMSFSLCASTVYIANDLLDLESDRQHPRKRARPFASGLVPAWMGVVLAPVLLALSGGADLVLIAHGVLPDQPACEQDLAACRAALEVNALSPVLFAEAFARCMAVRGRGTLAVIGSVAGDRGRKSNYVYGAAKGMVDRYLQGLRHRFAGSGVKVAIIKPGPTDMPMTAHLKGSTSLAPVDEVARVIVDGLERGREVIYAPGKWRVIMLVIRHLPGFVFNKMNI